MNVFRITTANTGLDSGITMDHRMRALDAPSMRADSSRSLGMPSKKLLSMKMAHAHAEKDRISDHRLSMSRMPKKLVNMM